MRGLKTTDTPILAGYQIFHNYIRPHEGLEGKTPAEACGITIEGKNKWHTLIQNASKKQLQNSLNWFRVHILLYANRVGKTRLTLHRILVCILFCNFALAHMQNSLCDLLSLGFLFVQVYQYLTNFEVHHQPF